MTGEHTSIRDLYEQQKAPIVQTLMGAMQADVPFRKGVADLYRVKLASGRECIVTGNHLFLTPDGWRFASSCLPSQRLLVSAPCHQESTEVLVPSVSQQDALHLSRIPLSSQERYSAYPHRYDARLQWETEVDPTAAPLSNGAHEHTHADLYTDDWQPLREYTHPHQYADRRAMKDYSPSLDDMAGTQFPSQQGTSSPIGSLYQDDAPFLREPYPLSPTAQALLDGDNTPRLGIWSMIYHSCLVDQLRGALASSTHWRLGPDYPSYDLNSEVPQIPPGPPGFNPSFDTPNL